MENRSIFEIVAAVLALTTIVGISIELHCEKRMRSYLASRNAELWMSEMQSRNAALDIADRLAVEIDIHNDTIWEQETTRHALNNALDRERELRAKTSYESAFGPLSVDFIFGLLNRGSHPDDQTPLPASQSAHASTSPS